MKVLITRDGGIRTIYSDDLDLGSLGETSVSRVACVEPWKGAWGVFLPGESRPFLWPFPKRKDALEAEILWVEKQML